MKCNQCGTEFEGKFCPECGAKAMESETVTPINESKAASDSAPGSSVNSEFPPIPEQPSAAYNESGSSFSQPEFTENVKKIKAKKPIYKKGWFIAILVIVIAAVAIVAIGGNRGEKIVWSDIKLSEVLPAPKSEKGEIVLNDEENLYVEIYKTSEEQFEDYVALCKDKGFTIETDSSSSSYAAFNGDGYKLSLIWYDSEMTINLDAPITLSDITWPTSTVGKMLPTPKSTKGKFNYEHDDSFSVYIGNTTESEYSEYVAACSDKGFNVDYDKGDTYYNANNTAGANVSIKYEGNNIMSISIELSDADSEKTASSSTTETTKATENTTKKATTDGLRPDFKAAMDSYEAFIDEYISFMKKYNDSNGLDASLISDYATYMSKYADAVKKFDAWESENLNDAETAYYIDVQARISKKLLDVS